MIPVEYLLLCFAAQAFLTWLVVRLMADEHKASINALVARNPQELAMLETRQAPKIDRRFKARIPDNEGEFAEARIRPMGL